jgi:hypothetical protein
MQTNEPERDATTPWKNEPWHTSPLRKNDEATASIGGAEGQRGSVIVKRE